MIQSLKFFANIRKFLKFLKFLKFNESVESIDESGSDHYCYKILVGRT